VVTKVTEGGVGVNKELKVFRSEQFGEIRTIQENGKLWFVASDACKALELSNPTMVMSRLDEDERSKFNLGRQGETNVVNEYGLYNLVLASRKPEAKQFKRWITHEVIPSIRKHGAYMTPQKIEEVLLNPDTIIQLATELKKERERRLALEPKAEAYDTFMDASNLQPMNDVAKCLGIGRNKLFALLREKKIIRSNNTPYQEYIDRGYFAVKEKPIKMGDASFNYAQTFVTAKGVDYISKLIEKPA